jgi:hypothetical protein
MKLDHSERIIGMPPMQEISIGLIDRHAYPFLLTIP